MGSLSTVTNLILVSAIGTTVTTQTFDIGMNEYCINTQGHYTALDECQYRIERQDEYIDQNDKFTILTAVAKQMTTTSQNIDPEFVKIVNDNFWDLI